MRLATPAAALGPAIISVLLLSGSARGGSIVDTRHNLSSVSPNEVRALAEEEVCLFCHTPHAARGVGVLWNRADSDAVYETYESSTALASIGQPTGSSRLCLSCHDGTVALGALHDLDYEVPFEGGVRFLDPEHGSLETSLADDHPISFLYDELLASENGELVQPSALPDEHLLDRNGQVQCTSCHDPHDDDLGFFLRHPPQFSQLCNLCHAKMGWGDGSHSLSDAQVPPGVGGAGPEDPPETVASRGCRGCHEGHGADAPERLRRFFQEEENCLPCHDGTVAALNLIDEFSKPSRHHLAGASGVHDPAELPENRERHVECEDCHNPHAANPDPGGQGSLPGTLKLVRGIDLSGSAVFPAAEEYEICMRCHGPHSVAVSRLPRLIEELDMIKEIETSNPSYHPIAGPGRNPDVPSLLSPWDETSIVFCTDCHNNDDGPGAGGSGPRGPHGSNHAPLLERNYSTEDYQPESEQAYELCYKCHDYQSILGDESFTKHKKHIRKEDTPCSVCHDPHGVSAAAGGTESNNTHLINFDRSIVFPNRDGELRFEDQGTFAGRCYLDCHGKDHHPKGYGQGGNGNG